MFALQSSQLSPAQAGKSLARMSQLFKPRRVFDRSIK